MAKRAASPSKAGKRSRRTSPPAKEAPPAAAPPSPPIVGIGASAGGLEAFTQLLRALPIDTGMAFVLVQHLEPKHESVLSTLLAHATEMPVHEVTEGMHVEPNHVYVIPANADLSLLDGLLHIVGRKAAAGRHLPIDYFFRSLAVARGPRAAGVILSGTASDGTAGMLAIKQEGGITFAQAPESAKFDGMPRSAIAAGCVDFVLPPERIAHELARIVRHSAISPPLLEAVPVLPAQEGEWDRLYRLLRASNGVDFSLYKKATIKRRLARRMTVNKVSTLGAYLKILEQNGPEVDAVFDELLILVTEFFRDPEVFQTLRQKILPQILKDKPADGPIRIWSAGCSTGQEAYSIAIEVLEFLGQKASGRTIQIFGTDASEAAIAKARAGIYSRQELKSVSETRMARFFKRVNGDYQVIERVRELCVFSRHDLIRDPPFSKLDLVSCRNVLIYFDTTLQKRVLDTFYYALRNEGCLLLGKSESPGVHSELFAAADRKRKYFRKNGTGQVSFSFAHPAYESAAQAKRIKDAPLAADLEKEADQALWERSAFAGLVVNDDLQILHFRGDTSRYLRPVPGKASFQLMRILREEIVLEVRSIIDKAKRTAKTARSEGIEIRHDGRSSRFNIEVRPMGGSGSVKNFLVLFEPASAAAPPKARPGKGANTRPTGEEARLRAELARTRDYVQAIIRDQETTNEELQTANEEALSRMEELQSSNEELETAKEELQSTNEELVTLNDQLQNRNAELSQLSGDLGIILGGIGIPIVTLDRDRRIRRFTPSAEKLLGLIPGDVGRPIGKIRIGIDIPDLDTLISGVMIKSEEARREVQTESGGWFLLRIHPFRGAEGRIEGVLMAFVDIQELKAHQEALARDRNFVVAVLNGAKELLVMVLDCTGRIEEFNLPCQQLTGYSLEEVRGRLPWDFLLPPEEAESARTAFHNASTGSPSRSLDHWITKDGQRLLISWLNYLTWSGDAPSSVISTGIDVTEMEEARRRALEAEATVRSILESAAQAILACDTEGHIRLANPTAGAMFGSPSAGLLGRSLETLFPERFRSLIAPDGREPSPFPHEGPVGGELELTGLRADGAEFPIEVAISHISSGQESLAVFFISDIAERQKSSHALYGYRDQQLASEVTSLSRLCQLSERLFQTYDLRSGLEEMIDAGMALLHADMGNIQLLKQNEPVLEIAAERGFGPAFLEHFREVSAADDSACGRSLRNRERTIIEDVETDPAFATHRAAAAAAGYRAVQSTPLFGRNGEPIGMFSTHFRQPHRPGADELRTFDLYASRTAQFIERLKSEERLRRSEASLPWGTLGISGDGRILLANRKAEQMFRYPAGSLVGQSLESLIPERFRDRHAGHFNAWFARPQDRPMGVGLKLSGLRNDGSEFPVEIALSYSTLEEGPLGIASVFDLSERKTEKTLLIYRDDLQKLTAALLSAREDADRQIARELHDDINQRLAVLANGVATLEQTLPSQSARGLRSALESLHATIAGLSDDLRRMSYRLHPPALEHLGLAAALESLCSQYSDQYRIKLEFTPRHVPSKLPSEMALSLYRIVQECLTNIVKHSGAAAAKVNIEGSKRRLRLSVSDNGTGFDPGEQTNGLGLISIRERVRLVDGKISINSRPGSGTRIEVEVPLAEVAS